jgi:hypothetical protein
MATSDESRHSKIVQIDYDDLRLKLPSYKPNGPGSFKAVLFLSSVKNP